MNEKRVQALLLFIIYIFSIVIYLVPISSNRSLLTSPDSILDEAHILSPNNHDANINTNESVNVNIKIKSIIEEEKEAWSNIFRNDYWGRDMNAPASHKSYRPFTVLTFRYVQRFITTPFQRALGTNDSESNVSGKDGKDGTKNSSVNLMISNLYLQRVVNVILHSTIVNMLSFLVPHMLLLPHSLSESKPPFQPSSSWIIFSITAMTQLFFTLHPSHSEIVVNIANRGHLLSILFLLVSISIPLQALDASNTSNSTWINLVWLTIVYTLGLLSSETFLFYLPIVIVTWIWIYIVNYMKDRYECIWMKTEMKNKKRGFELQERKEPSNSNHYTPEGDPCDNQETKMKQIAQTEQETNTKSIAQKPAISTIKIVTFTQQIKNILYEIYPQIIVITTISMLYLYIRHINDWISIPTALIRRAENPFLTILQETQLQQKPVASSQYSYDYLHPRIKYHINYILILCIHVIKSLGMGIVDIIGLSHEYGYNCIPEMKLKTTTIGNVMDNLLSFMSNFFKSSWLWNIGREIVDDDDGISSSSSSSSSAIGDNNHHSINEWKIVYFDDERSWIIATMVLFFIVLLFRFCSLYHDDSGGNVVGDFCTNRKKSKVNNDRENNDMKERYSNEELDKRNMKISMNTQDAKPIGVMLWIVFCVWIFASLFPVSGFMKVGTFVADRLVVPSTVITSLFWGGFFTYWIYAPFNNVCLQSSPTLTLASDSSGNDKLVHITNNRRITFNQIVQFLYRCLILFTILTFLSIRTFKRNQEWMTSKSLLESSLRVCPNNAKSNLEISKIYSGLYYPKIYDLNKALEYLHKVEEIIDGDEYCDVHYQFGFVYYQQQECLKFEERIIKGILCPFTMQGSHSLFQQYWKVMLNTSSDNHELGGEDARRRYMKYVKIIQDAIQEEAEKENSEMMRSNEVNHDGTSVNSSKGVLKNEL